MDNNKISNNSFDAELLFLIYKYLNYKGQFNNTITSLEKEIDALHLLGKSYNWDGSPRDTTISDLYRRFLNFKGNQLESILSSQNISSGLMNLNKSDPFQILDDSKQLINIYNILVQTKRKYIKLSNRRLYLHQQLESDAFHEDFNHSDVNVAKTLKFVGQHKELLHVNSEIDSLETARKVYEKDASSLYNGLTKSNAIVNSLFREECNNPIAWLNNRTLGFTSSFSSNGNLISKGLSMSSTATFQKLTTSYNFLWTVSGHMMNPAYCVVFDKTGQYVITGADDYLVKVWEVDRGVLIYTLKGHEGYIALIDVSPDNSIIASACTFGSIRLWSLEKGTCLKVLNHGGSINWIKFDDNTSALATAGDEGNCIVWDISKMLHDDFAITPDDWKCKYPLLDILKNESMKTDTNTDISNKILDIELSIPPLDIIDSSVIKFDGLFNWSKGHMDTVSNSRSNGEVKLVLSHLQDSLQLMQSNSDAIKVNCLDISPYRDIIITGCDDGVARVWKFGNDIISEKSNRSSSNRNTTDSTLLLSNLRGHIPSLEFKKIEIVNNHLLQRLEGHVSAITDLRFSKRGDRIVTGSLNDGTVRIWSFNRNFTKHEQIVLIMKDNDTEISDSSNNFTYGPPSNRRSSSSRKQLKTQVYNVAWTCDDSRVISLQSVLLSVTDNSMAFTKDLDAQDLVPTRLKVWDSYTGDLLRTIPFIGMKACKLLTLHPKNPAIALTSGLDGIINIWDIEYEKKICSFNLVDPSDPSERGNSAPKPSHIVDASFSPDGVFVALTDTVGRLTMLSIDRPSKHPQKYPEQYFSNDYADFTVTPDGFAVDVNTQLPVHDAPRGLLCRMDGYAYDSQPTFTGFGPKPLSLSETSEDYQNKLISKKKLSRLMDKTYGLFQRNKLRGRQARQFTWNSETKSSTKLSKQPPILRQQKQKSMARVSSMFETSAIGFNVVNYLSYSDDSDSNYSNKFNDLDDEVDVVRRKRRNLRNSSDDTRITRLNRGRRSSSTRESRALARASKNERINISTTHLTRNIRRQIIVDSDDDGDHDSSNISVYSDNNDNNDNSDNDNSKGDIADNKSDNSKEAINKAKIKQPRNVTSSTIPRIRKSNAISYCDWGVYLNGRRTVPASLVEIDREWLQDDTVHDSQYCPQRGDHVIYFPQGHIEMLHNFAESSRPPWASFPQRWPLVECIVKDLAYEFPTITEYKRCPSVLCIVTLQIVGIPIRRQITSISEYVIEFGSQRQTRNSSQTPDSAIFANFTVTLRNFNIPDFIIPYHLFFRSCNKVQWHEGIRISVTYRDLPKPSISPSVLTSNQSPHTLVDHVYTARVVKLSDASSEWPQSPWEALQIRFESENPLDEETNNVSPIERIGIWEAVPLIDSSNNYSRACLRYPAPKLPDDLCHSIENKIGRLIESHKDLYSPFEYEVDSTIFPEYYGVIPVPMYLDLIRRRLRNQYYRQIEALEFDVEEIHRNCLHFNVEGTEIIDHAAQLSEQLRQILRGEDPLDNNVSNSRIHNDISQLNESSVPMVVTSNSTPSDNEEKLILRVKRGRKANVDLDRVELPTISNEHKDNDDRLVLRIRNKSRTNYLDQSNILSERIRSTREHKEVLTNNYPDESTTRSRRQHLNGTNANHYPDEIAIRSSRRQHKEILTNKNPDEIITTRTRSSNRSNFSFQKSKTRSSDRLINKSIHYNEDNDNDDGNSSVYGNDVHSSVDNRSRIVRKSASAVDSDSSSSSSNSSSSNNNNSSTVVSDDSDDSSSDENLNIHMKKRSLRSSSQSIKSKSSNTRDENIERKSKRIRNEIKYEINDNDEGSDEDSKNISTRLLKRNKNSSNLNENEDFNNVKRSLRLSSHQYDQNNNSISLRSSSRNRNHSSKQFTTYNDADNNEIQSVRPIRSTRSSHANINNDNNIARCSLSNLSTGTSSRDTNNINSKSDNHFDQNNKISLKRQDPEVRRRILKLLTVIENEDKEKLFFDPVTDDIAEGYSLIVSNPMDLSTIRMKYQSRQYESMDDILEDFELMFDNCELFNDSKSFVYKESKRLRKVLYKFIETQFSE